MFEKSKKYLEKKAARVGLVMALLGSSAVALSSCDFNGSDATRAACAVYDTFGQQMEPRSYPLVDTTVTFKQPDGFWHSSNFVSEKVDVTDANNKYTLAIHNFPNLLGNFDDLNTQAWPHSVAVQVDMPTEGTIGVTTGCIIRGFDKQGFPVGIVQLPTYDIK